MEDCVNNSDERVVEGGVNNSDERVVEGGVSNSDERESRVEGVEVAGVNGESNIVGAMVNSSVPPNTEIDNQLRII